MTTTMQEIRFRGAPICRGIAIGNLFFFDRKEREVSEVILSSEAVEEEIARFQEALNRSRQDINRLQKKLNAEGALEGAVILEAQLMMLEDPLITTHIEAIIRGTKRNAEFAFKATIKKYQSKFDALSDPFFRDRFKDIQDISRRVMEYMNKGPAVSLDDVPAGSIVFASELTPSDMAEAESLSIGGFVTELGGMTSHTAIVAIAKGIPYVANVSFDLLDLSQEYIVIIDGRIGEIILNPTPRTLGKYEKLKTQLQGELKVLERMASLPSETYDGYRVRLSANIEMSQQLDLVHRYGAHGVGLFRSEYIFFPKNEIPSEEQQFQIYQQLIQKMKGLPLVIRAFDLGGDKSLPGYLPKEGNPFLGCRAIRFLLREKKILKTQLRAIIRAGVGSPVSVLFPMISTLAEFLEVKQIIREIERELGIRPEDSIRVGCMIEVPSAALIADHLAKECDFISIGTNDLVQYSLAVDRGNQVMANLYDPANPSILRLIKLVTSEADQKHVHVSVCGEIAADPRFTALLLGLGVQELSVAPRYLPIVKQAIRNTSIVEAVDLAERALCAANSHEVLELISNAYKSSVPEDNLYNC
jgi:phosphoenolpyruvate-protein phosphotransferase (PTS system enzyme I)